MKKLTHPIETPAAWSPAQLDVRTDWLIELTAPQIEELVLSSDSVSDPDRRWTDIPNETYTLPAWTDLFERLRLQLEGGLGFALLRALPVKDVSAHAARTMLWGLGQHLGYPEKQDAAGHLVHDVRDTGKDLNTDNIRAYQTNLPIHYHNDGADAFMLLCYRAARKGGRSQLISAPMVFNTILDRRPDLAAVLQEPFDFDTRGQGLPGAPPYQRVPIYNYHDGLLSVLYKRQYIDLAQRFPEVPALTERQVEALDLMDKVCGELAFEFTMDPGDIVVANNYDILHARSAFEDGDSDAGRHMMRLWLSLPNGRSLPPVFAQTREFCNSYARRATNGTA